MRIFKNKAKKEYMKTSWLLLALITHCLAFGQDTPLVQTDAPPTIAFGDSTIVEFADVAPEFMGGMDSLKAYLSRNLHYPEDALLYEIQGKVYLSFVVERNGHITNVRVERGIHPPLDAEAIRLVEFMPPWKPGELQHKVVRARARLPINFTLD